ncbi:CCA tRNA nucleotidyltransferase [Dolosigranulum savutiense]|uniref:CCA-adding enzyme n=1 Tax=Dolosigranulum savutiense TaxID=3110288 RepID=A0AB74U9K8_9LACT
MTDKLTFTPMFKQALPVLRQLTDHGYEAYFVGGSVRDALLGLEVNDIDIATSALPEEIKEIFPRTVDVGIDHGTVMVMVEGEAYEITTFRTESTYQDFRRPDSVEFVRSLREDLQRRDFTINAMAVDETGMIYDYYDGQADLEEGIIRAVGKADERFNEDALRMMRAVRFSAQLGFNIEASTELAIKENASLLQHIAVERIHIEFVKLICSQSRSKGLKSMLKTKLFEYCPELASNKLALMYLSNNKGYLENERQAWSLLVYYMNFLMPTHYCVDIRQFLRQWKSSNQVIAAVEAIVSGVQKRQATEKMDPFDIYQLGAELARDVEYLLTLIDGSGHPDEATAIHQSLQIKSQQELALSGSDIMMLTDRKPGPWLGQVLSQLVEEVIYDRLDNDPTLLRTYVTEQLL